MSESARDAGMALRRKRGEGLQMVKGVYARLGGIVIGLAAVAGCSPDEESRREPRENSWRDRTDAIVSAYPGGVSALTEAEQTKLLPSDGAADDYFGNSVSVSGDTAVVGARFSDDSGINSGSAYVFVRRGGVWTEQAKLLPGDGAANDFFGSSVSVSGDTAVVGARTDSDNGIGSGSAYTFVRNGGVWEQQSKLLPSDGALNDYFGWSVSISGDTAVVGAEGNDDSGSDSGSAYVFVRSGAVWTEQSKLLAGDGAGNDFFGQSVSVSGDTIIAGASSDDNGSNSGSVYVFVRSGAVWTEQSKLLASDGAANDTFGRSVSISGDTAVVGASGDDDSGSLSGSAYTFVRSGGVWTEQSKLLASDGAVNDFFGQSVSVSGDTLVVGADGDDNDDAESGSAYVFVRSGSVWTERAKLLASDGAASDFFGQSVSVSGDTAVVGSYLDDDSGADSGSAYIFAVPGRSLGQACASSAVCMSGFCVDGVCCDTVCDDGAAVNCMACSVASGAVADGTCGLAEVGTVCRAAAGACDVAEACDGVSVTCPGDALQTESIPCPGGVCIAGICLIDTPPSGSAAASSSSGAGSAGGASSSSGAGGASGAGGSGSGAAGGKGAATSGVSSSTGVEHDSDDSGELRLRGGGCAVSQAFLPRSSNRPAGTLASGAPWLFVGLLVAARRRRGADPSAS